jgi:PadR family transcriptional regulator PadR
MAIVNQGEIVVIGNTMSHGHLRFARSRILLAATGSPQYLLRGKRSRHRTDLFAPLPDTRQRLLSYTRSASTKSLQRFGSLCRLSSMGEKNRDVRMSLQTLRVLEVFLDSPTDELSGADVIKRGGLASGTLYPILFRLESAGWFVSRWEKIDPATAGRPRRRLYRLTPAGLQHASSVLASFTFRRGLPA